MARSRSSTSTARESSSPAASSSNRVARSRIVRTASAATTTNRSRMLAEASSNATLQTMMDEAQDVVAGSSRRRSSGKGKGKAVRTNGDSLMEETDSAFEGVHQADDVCPIIDKNINPFRIMDLPTEIRLEVYRACLTRPYNILLSKREQPPTTTTEDVRSTPTDENIGLVETSDDDELERGFALPGRRSNASSRRAPGGNMRASASRRPLRLLSGRSVPGNLTSHSNAFSSTNNGSAPSGVQFVGVGPRNPRTVVQPMRTQLRVPEPERLQSQDPLLVNILCASKQIYKEARSVLYSENFFTLDLNTAMSTLGCLHQRSRRLIKHVELEIPTYNEILERFQETVRLSLRYCLGLKKFVIHMPFTLPGADGSGTTGNTTVYANGFDILRWLPQECEIVMKGNICSEIETVVSKHKHLAKALDKLAYARRQLISNDTGSSSTIH